MTDKQRRLLDLLKPLLPITEEMEHNIRTGDRMVVDTIISVKVILERKSKFVWTNNHNPSEILVTIIYSGRPGPDAPIQLIFAVEDLFHAIQATGITEDSDLTYFSEDIAIDKDGNIVENPPPLPNVLKRLNRPK